MPGGKIGERERTPARDRARIKCLCWATLCFTCACVCGTGEGRVYVEMGGRDACVYIERERNEDICFCLGSRDARGK